MKTKVDLIDYAISDALYVNFSKNRSLLERIKAKLLGRLNRRAELHHLFSFCASDILVVIQNQHSGHFKELHVLNSKSKSYISFDIYPKREEDLIHGAFFGPSCQPERTVKA